MITFTIITCTYNAASVLQRTLDSVLKQTYQNVEHIILDGKSKDDTLQIAERYKLVSDNVEETRHQVIVVSEPDKGLYDAMNKGIDKATGNYIVFLNAGDVFPTEDTLETIANSVGEGEELPGVLYGETDVVDDNGTFIRHRRLQVPKALSWRSFKWGMLVCHQAFYARVDLARENHYNLNYRLSADVDWCIRIMKSAEQHHLSLCNVNAVIVNYLDGGMSIKNHKASLKERYRIMSSHYGFIQTSLLHLWFVIRSLLKK
jgi:glycosyltransferase involved in cell wall biosynthesis